MVNWTIVSNRSHKQDYFLEQKMLFYSVFSKFIDDFEMVPFVIIKLSTFIYWKKYTSHYRFKIGVQCRTRHKAGSPSAGLGTWCPSVVSYSLLWISNNHVANILLLFKGKKLTDSISKLKQYFHFQLVHL